MTRDVSIRGRTYFFADEEMAREQKPVVNVDETAAPLNLAERNRCIDCKAIVPISKLGTWVDCKKDSCVAARLKRWKLREQERHAGATKGVGIGEHRSGDVITPARSGKK